MEVEEMNVEDLFEDEAHDRDEDDPDEEGQDQETSGAQLELGGKGEGSKEGGGAEKPKKRIVKNPQPKLNPDRILGSRGVPILEQVFADFKPKGKGEEFRDLEVVMKRLEHWAHRLYPKLPFDDVMNRISQLGKKKNVQVNLKKIRMGMPTFVDRPESDEDEAPKLPDFDDEEDKTKRYEDDGGAADDDDALFDLMMKEAQERESQRAVASSQAAPNVSLSDEQRERMLRNQKIAEEKRLARIRQKAEAESQALSSQDIPVVEMRDESGAGFEGETLNSQILSCDDGNDSMDE